MTPSRVPVSTDGELEQVIRSDCDCQTLRKSLDKDDKNEEGKGKWLKSKNAVNEGEDVKHFLFYFTYHVICCSVVVEYWGRTGILFFGGTSIPRSLRKKFHYGLNRSCFRLIRAHTSCACLITSRFKPVTKILGIY